jgi:hypothetical protein
MSETPQRFMLHGTGKDALLLVHRDEEFFSGWTVAPDLELVTGMTPLFRWTKAKIPMELWQKIVAFMKWGFKAHQSEVLITLFYNATEDRWDAWPFAQNPMGMTVNYVTEHPTYAIDRAQFNGEWVQLGSVHHHCTMAAFQSGTDKTDEADRDGIHITIGKINSNPLDLHARQTFFNVFGDTKVADWIEIPDWMRHVPEEYQPSLLSQMVVNPANTDFPEEWKARVLKKIYPFSGQRQTTITENITPNKGRTLTPQRTMIGGTKKTCHVSTVTGNEPRIWKENKEQFNGILYNMFCDSELEPSGMAELAGLFPGQMSLLLNDDYLLGKIADGDRVYGSLFTTHPWIDSLHPELRQSVYDFAANLNACDIPRYYVTDYFERKAEEWAIDPKLTIET